MCRHVFRQQKTTQITKNIKNFSELGIDPLISCDDAMNVARCLTMMNWSSRCRSFSLV